MSDSSCGNKISDSVCQCHKMTLILMPNMQMDEGKGSDSSCCSACALADQTSDRKVTLEPSIKSAVMLVCHLYQKVIEKRWVEEREEEDRIRKQ